MSRMMKRPGRYADNYMPSTRRRPLDRPSKRAIGGPAAELPNVPNPAADSAIRQPPPARMRSMMPAPPPAPPQEDPLQIGINALDTSLALRDLLKPGPGKDHSSHRGGGSQAEVYAMSADPIPPSDDEPRVQAH
jgi:hypothetical protein